MLDFGDYCLIEQKRYGVENEMYVHKVIGRLRSNHYVEVPVDARKNGINEVKGDMADVVRCVCCGVSETKVRKYRIQDVTPTDRRFPKGGNDSE